MSTRICVSSPEGDPTARTTWSGTPANLCQTLREMGRLHGTIDTSNYLPVPLPKLIKGLAGIYYRGFYATDRGLFARHLRAREVERQIRRFGATDVIHTGTLDMPVFKANPGVRHYLYCDVSWRLLLRAIDDPQFSPALLRDIERLERATYQQLEHIFCTAEYVRESLVADYGVSPGRVTVVGTGCGAIQPFHGEKDYVRGPILFVAKINFAGKGGPALVAGFKLALQRSPALRLIIVGDPAYRALVGDLPNVEIRGFVELAQLQRLFEEAALFAMPALREPWGLVYLEALNCKTPILALRRNAIPEITNQGEFGYMLADDSPASVADALVDAFSHPARLAQMGAAGQQATLHHYTWQGTVGRMLEVIDRCAA